VKGDEQALEQVIKQLSKLVDVIKIVELKSEESVERELALIKVKAENNRRSDIVNLVSVFRANIIDVNKETMIIETLGDAQKISAFCAVLEDYGIVELVRTGKIALSRKPVAVKQ